MANKILLKHKGDVGDHFEASDSENEYTEREKQLLQKVRKGRQRNAEAEQQILAFDQNDDSDEEEGLLIDLKQFDSDKYLTFDFRWRWEIRSG